MSGPPRVRSVNIAEPENKAPEKPVKKTEPKKCGKVASSVLRQKSMNASYSSDASSESSNSRASSSSSSSRRVRWTAGVRKKQCGRSGGGDSVAMPVSVAVESGNYEVSGATGGGISGGLLLVEDKVDGFQSRKRCGWVTPSTDPCYAAFHDEEWGVPVHDDKKLFELLSLSGALAELTWPAILNKRHIFREVFLEFDPHAVSRLNEKKIAMSGSPASSLLSELKLRSIIENARQICKVIDEFGSFDRYIWNFVNHKPIVSQFRYSRQVPVKTPKAELISKDLVRRGFRSVGPTVVYSFMQVAGLTNDHLMNCFRFPECITGAEVKEKDYGLKAKAEKKEPEDAIGVGLSGAMDA